LETPMSPGGSQASAGEGVSPCKLSLPLSTTNVVQPLSKSEESEFNS